jgi:diguanylate cyclase (GGDEF)-like protein
MTNTSRGVEFDVLTVQAVTKKGIIYLFIQRLFSTHPSVHWVCVGLVTALLCLLLFINQKWLERFPLYMYMSAVLGSILLLDLLTQTIPILTVYLIVLGYVLFRSSDENPYVITFCFTACYLLVSIFTVWNQFMLIELISHSLLFVWVAWMSDQVRAAFFELQKQKEKIGYLIEQKNESNKRLRDFQKELEETYLRDPLTGLYNFHGFQQQVIRSLARNLFNQPFHVVCLDLTDFRQVNMKEGIDVGDRILVRIAHALKKYLPATAKLARYDGDQFAIGLMGDSLVLRRILETVDCIMKEIQAEKGYLHYCLGTATYPQEARTGGQLIRLAEERLTLKQRSIRNKEEEHRRHLEKLSALGQLAAGLAHEIRNPLTSIRGFVQISAAESEAVKKWESIILPEIDRINDLLKQFLNLSEVKPVQVTRFNLGQLMGDVLSLLEPKSLLMGHELKQIPPPYEMEIEADGEQLKQVMINLIQNGLEALTSKGTVEVSWARENNYAHISVKDTGDGIHPEHMTRIFDPFFTTKGDGTGMGLSICHRIITEHGGEIFVNSQPGLGTTFNIYLPLRQANTGELQTPAPDQSRSDGVPETNENESLPVTDEQIAASQNMGDKIEEAKETVDNKGESDDTVKNPSDLSPVPEPNEAGCSDAAEINREMANRNQVPEETQPKNEKALTWKKYKKELLGGKGNDMEEEDSLQARFTGKDRRSVEEKVAEIMAKAEKMVEEKMKKEAEQQNNTKESDGKQKMRIVAKEAPAENKGGEEGKFHPQTKTVFAPKAQRAVK